jgi:hypothetical protein
MPEQNPVALRKKSLKRLRSCPLRPIRTPPGLRLGVFNAQVKRERATFFERLVSGQTVCKEYGAEFNWREEHALTIIRAYAEQIAAAQIMSGEFIQLACARFLEDLANGANR